MGNQSGEYIWSWWANRPAPFCGSAAPLTYYIGVYISVYIMYRKLCKRHSLPAGEGPLPNFHLAIRNARGKLGAFERLSAGTFLPFWTKSDVFDLIPAPSPPRVPGCLLCVGPCAWLRPHAKLEKSSPAGKRMAVSCAVQLHAQEETGGARVHGWKLNT